MKSLNFKSKKAVLFFIIIVVGVFAWQGIRSADAFYFFKIGKNLFGGSNNVATATNSSLSDPSKKNRSFLLKQKKQTKNNKKINKNKKAEDFSREIPFGISNPYDQESLAEKQELAKALKDIGLSDSEKGAVGFVVDSIARRNMETSCDKTACQYDFSTVKNLIDGVVGQGKANLWVVIGSPSNNLFTDGKQRENEKTYLPDGPVSRLAYKDYLEKMVSFVNLYGKQASGNPDWYVPLWNLYNEVNAEYRKTFDNLDEATTAYANFVIDSSEVLRRLSPKSKIVLAGSGSGTDLKDKHGEFYRLLFSKLKQSAHNYNYEFFDYWESHWFGGADNYKANEEGYGVKEFINFLQDNGYGDKGFVIRAGGTYSGQDNQERKGLMSSYQSEKDQAGFLVKRFIYNVANGVKKIAWSTIYERDKYQGERHVHFQFISLIYDGYPDGSSKNQKCVEGWLPCPDPGFGVKKLSYYSFKSLIEKLKGIDWNNIQTVQESQGVYVYKFNKENKSLWVAWNDNETSKQITISGIKSNKIKITEAVPKYESGKDVADYDTAFNLETKTVNRGSVTAIIENSPVFVEEI